ncbi:class A beta-lactamase-related serine hydrolase [Thermosynechococcus sp. HN-54]|uniref:serine hydrolase n=1 Tax=Thermosynechococcus sp. HN-54 TaxID=2933959 RepID=UPI00202CAC58|nr:serine hydrolase [Thermosynechococcus sp. HN-54]URR34468.1 class A beta-lactamase-related serine hydrolase [Thermosynechococcus sp. HN-54]
MLFFQVNPYLTDLLTRTLQATWQQFPWLGQEDIALTLLVYPPPVPVNTGGALTAAEFWQYQIPGAHYRGDVLMYPASVVKLFYLVACHEWLHSGMLQPDVELERAMRDMIVDSSNDATSLVVDMLTGTTSGPVLPPEPFRTWQYQRNIVNRYFQSLGWPELANINVNQKTWCDGPYGREQEFVGRDRQNANRLTTNATAKLIHSIVGGVAVSASASQAMMELMERSLDPELLAEDPENQVQGFLGEGLPQGAKLWSKAGLTSWVRHDAAYIELPNHCPYTLVVFMENRTASTNTEVLPFISRQIASGIPTLEGAGVL